MWVKAGRIKNRLSINPVLLCMKWTGGEPVVLLPAGTNTGPCWRTQTLSKLEKGNVTR